MMERTARLYRSAWTETADGHYPAAVLAGGLTDWRQEHDAGELVTIRALVSEEQHARLLAEPGVERVDV